MHSLIFRDEERGGNSFKTGSHTARHKAKLLGKNAWPFTHLCRTSFGNQGNSSRGPNNYTLFLYQVVNFSGELWIRLPVLSEWRARISLFSVVTEEQESE